MVGRRAPVGGAAAVVIAAVALARPPVVEQAQRHGSGQPASCRLARPSKCKAGQESPTSVVVPLLPPLITGYRG